MADRELANLLDVYNDRSDQELLSLYENRDDLTELAQQALTQVIRDRGLSVTGVPVMDAGQQHRAAVKDALDDDEVELQTFDDAFRLNEALRLLTAAEIPHRVVNWDEILPQGGGPRLALGLIVGRAEEAEARRILQAEMKLFPTAPEGTDSALEEDGFAMLGIFSRADALRLAQVFGSEGISFLWTDGREVFTLEEEEVRVEVFKKNLERAHALVSQTLGA
jgi:hypothetical protein